MEEETEAMASQSLDDIFSKLPEHIIHHILDLLPSTKDVVRTSAISKSWLQAWLTFPITEFDPTDFVNPNDISEDEFDDTQTQQNFIRFVESSLQRLGRLIGDRNGYRMKIFNLQTLNNLVYYNTRWIGMALDYRVEHLTLRFIRNYPGYPRLILDRVLSAYWLKSLVLAGHRIDIPLNEVSRVNLPSLTSLHIKSSRHINDEKLQKLLSGCPALEVIALLGCESLSKVDIFQHPNLKTLEFIVTRADNAAIRVSAPKLKSFNYTCACCGQCDAVVEIHNSPELTFFRISNCNKTDQWFHKFIAQFPLIKFLSIEECNALRKIRISNPLLEKINFKYCNSLENVVISCKKLTYFFLGTLHSLILNPSIRMEMDNAPKCSLVNVSCDHYQFRYDLLMESSWYCKLKEFLTRPFKCEVLRINVRALFVDAVDGDMTGKDLHKKLPSAACTIEMLILNVVAASSYNPHILNGLLCACHPTTIKLDVIDNANFVKLVCKELRNRENNGNCCCKDDFKCWKHQLKQVKIEKILGIELEEDLDCDSLFDLLPILDGSSIYFKLLW